MIKHSKYAFDNSAIRAAALADSSVARMLRDIDSSPAIRAMRDMQKMAESVSGAALMGQRFLNDHAAAIRSIEKIASSSGAVQKIIEDAGKTALQWEKRYGLTLKSNLRALQDVRSQFDAALNIASPVRAILEQANELTQQASLAIKAQSKFDPDFLEKIGTLVEQYSAAAIDLADRPAEESDRESAANSQDSWDKVPRAQQILYVMVILGVVIQVWQALLPAISPEQLDQTNKYLAQIVEHLVDQAPSSGQLYVTTTAVSMRSGPSRHDQPVSTLPAGTAVIVTESDGDWRSCEVTSANNEPRYGWIYRKYLVRKPISAR